MNIAFDAKRAFHNQTGLGHYSRTLIRSLSEYYPGHHYYLMNPKVSALFDLSGKNITEVLPKGILNNTIPSAWRSSWVTKDLEKLGIDLYHGLSHEIPVGIGKTGIASVVTIHDLIHERYPAQYNPIDVRIYNRKFRYACENADHIIAISEQTKNDIVEFYKVDSSRITVCYQSCSPAFSENVSEVEKQRISKKYQLPGEFFLYVGSIIERKNLLNIVKAMYLLRDELSVPLVVIGNGGKYLQQVKDFILQYNLESRIIFLSEHPSATSREFQNASDFPAIYQQAIAMIYPSTFEGFGIPVLEALNSRLPVITSNVSCLPEAGGPSSLYVDPFSSEDIAAAMRKVYTSPELREEMIREGLIHAGKFTPRKCATAVMGVYQRVIKETLQLSK